MTKFEDGPAKGQTLMLKRAPIFLRVTDCGGKFDALDQLDDSPRKDEKLHAYIIILEKSRGSCHIRRSGGGGGFYPIAEYRLVVKQPGDTVMRDNDRWTEWCKKNCPPNIKPA